jgi:sentrin-specific protease 1
MDMDKIFFPVHVHGNHWCLAVINLRNKRFEYYDPLLVTAQTPTQHKISKVSNITTNQGGPGQVLQNLRRYVEDESKEYSNLPHLDVSGWSDYVPDGKDIPLQGNGFDCGVFMCKFADYMSDGLDLTFRQEDMSYFRRRMMTDLIAKSAD